MTVYIALLRGINVGGKNIISMKDLKEIFESVGLSDVKTYIQSGNVLFKSDKSENVIQMAIENEIQSSLGLSVPVILRTSAELQQIILNCPFSEEEIFAAKASSKSESLYVSLLNHVPLQEKIEILKKYKNDSEDYKVAGRDIYMLFRNSIRNSKLANNLQKLEVSSTVRNWQTINKLNDLSKAMDIF